MTKSKSKPTTKAASTPDAALVLACVHYAQALGAATAAFIADPDPSSKHAGAAAGPAYRRADKLLEAIGAMKATTATGLAAKARIITIAIDADEGSLEDRTIAFFNSFAAEAKLYFDDVISTEWRAERDAAKGAK